MSTVQLERISAGHFRIKGDLNFNSVPELWLQNKEELFNDQSDVVEIDFSQLRRSDSSGLALLLEWYREAIQRGKKIIFLNLPEQMFHVAEICSLNEVLPLKNNESLAKKLEENL